MYDIIMTFILGLDLAFDESGRPLEPAFYTGFPAYHNLLYQIFEKNKELETQQLRAGEEKEENVVGEGGQRDGEGGHGEEGRRVRNEPPKFWLKKEALANILEEDLPESQVRGCSHVLA